MNSKVTGVLSINTATVRAQGNLLEIFECVAQHGITHVSPWRDQVHAVGLHAASQLRKSLGLKLTGYCRGGMFTAKDAAGVSAALDDNRKALDEASEMQAPCLILVVGGVPEKDIITARQQVLEGIGTLLEFAKKQNVPLAIEPLHPMYAADRACVNTLEQALDICDQLDPTRSGALGVAVDAYHVWWDPKVHQQIARAGKERILAYHVCDWLVPTTDLLLDRGMMGDGVIDLKGLRRSVEAAGFNGPIEAEIFSQNNWWKRPMDEVIKTCIERHATVV